MREISFHISKNINEESLFDKTHQTDRIFRVSNAEGDLVA